MQNETANKIKQWEGELARGVITQEQYETNIANREAEEKRLSTTYMAEAKKRSEIEKATAIAQTTMATYEMAVKAFKAMVGIPIVGPALATAASAAAIALGMKNISIIKNTAAYLRGGLVKGGKQIIQVNEEGEEFVLNASATRKLGSALLAKVQAFPERARVALDNIAFPSINVPTPAFAFASGGSTENIINDNTVINQLQTDIDSLKEVIKTELKQIKTVIQQKELRMEFDSTGLAQIVEKGNRALNKRNV